MIQIIICVGRKIKNQYYELELRFAILQGKSGFYSGFESRHPDNQNS